MSLSPRELLPSLPYTHARAMEYVRLAESAGRPHDMAQGMRLIVDDATAQERVLTPEERLMFSVSFKNRLSPLRGCLKMLALVDEHEHDSTKLACVRKYASDIEDQVVILAGEVLGLIGDKQCGVAERYLASLLEGELHEGAAEVAAASKHYAVEALIYCLKLAADYCRYVAEAHSDPEVVRRHSDLALMLYSKSSAHAATHLHPAHPTRLGNLLNFSVFLFEVRHCEGEAYEIGSSGLEEAQAVLASSSPFSSSSSAAAFPPLTVAERRDSEAVQRLLVENMGVWKQVMLITSKSGGAPRTVEAAPPLPGKSPTGSSPPVS